MTCLYRASVAAVLLLFGSLHSSPGANPPEGSPAANRANRLTYLDSTDPFYVGAHFPKLSTPQWIGEPGIDAAVILAVDDMTETGKYEVFLRPILDRLKLIDGRAPVSIMTRSLPVADPQAQKWLKEGLSLEIHTAEHPCPLLANGDFEAAANNYYECVDLLNQVPGNQPVAFRMPCCDSQNSTSPRFFAEIFNYPSPRGNFLTIDSSVMNLFTSSDPTVPRELVLDSEGHERFRRYFPSTTNAITRVSLEAFSTTIENYPYPYVIGKLCWEFPCAVPSDWEAYNFHGPTNRLTVADWQAGLDATVLKQGVFTMIFHPHGWIRNDQLVEFIDYATAKYGNRIKFLTFREANARLNQNLLLGQSLRAANGQDNGVRLLDLNNDGYLDVVIGNGNVRATRTWQPSSSKWSDTNFPVALVSSDPSPQGRDLGVKFGIAGPAGRPTAFFRNEGSKGAWHFDGSAWLEDAAFFSGLTLQGQPVLTMDHGRDRGVRLRDIDNDGRCDLLLGNESQNAIFSRSTPQRPWIKKPFGLPAGTSIVDANGEDNGLRFVDLNQDGFDDILFSNEKAYSVHMFLSKSKPLLGLDVGWSYLMRSGTRGQSGDVPMIVRGGSHPNNGAWFRSQHLCVQNEDTSSLPDKTWRASFADLQQGSQPPSRSPSQALEAFHLAPGFKIELVAAEPLVLDPVAFDWGADGRLWVVEMRDYPLGIDGKGKPGGVIRVLEDTHGDGRYDKSTVFLEGLSFPNGLLPWRNGLLVSAAPDIFYAEDTDGDGKADLRQLLFTGFREGNQQHRVNGFDYGLDNWIYAANGGSGGTVRGVAKGTELILHAHDLRLRPDEGLMEPQPGPSQFGRHRDDWGNWFGNENDHWLWHYFLPDQYLARNPHLAVSSTYRILANDPDPGRIFAISRPQQRFNWPNRTFEVTSACSPMPYRDDLFGPDFTSSVFICEPANNVVHREVLETRGVTFNSHRAAGETNSEFLASTDNWFRPTMVKTGPDGALYVADMYRLIIEHPEYFPEELKSRPDLRAGEDKGRIYRIYPAKATLPKTRRLDRLNTTERVAALNTPNGWQRDTLQRLLVQSHDLAAVGPLEDLVRGASDPRTRLQALCTLEGLHSLTPQILMVALSDSHYALRRQALAFAEPLFGKFADLDARLLALVEDPDPRVRYQLAFSLGAWTSPRVGAVLARLAIKDWADEAMQTALLSSAPAHIDQLLPAVLAEAGAHPIPDTLVEQCLTLATEMSSEAALADALARLGEAQGARFATWQIAGAIGLLNGLDQRNLSLASFAYISGPSLRTALARLPALFDQARQTAINPQAPESERLLALRTIGREPEDQAQDLAVLGDLLDPHNSIAIQQAALAGLRGSTNPPVAEVLLKYWRAAGPVQRQEIINALFSRTAWIEAVMTALEDGRLSPSEVGALEQQRLLNHAMPEIQDRAAKLFSQLSSDRRKVIERYRGVADLTGDRSRGHTLFLQNCAVCHSLQGEGHNVGPDLGTIADKPVQTLVVAILDPNQAVDPAYASYIVTTVDDRELSGILVAETSNSISLRMPGGAEEVILRSKLKEIISSGRSPMPEGFETGLKPQDLADVIAYISSAGNPANP